MQYVFGIFSYANIQLLLETTNQSPYFEPLLLFDCKNTPNLRQYMAEVWGIKKNEVRCPFSFVQIPKLCRGWFLCQPVKP